MAPPGAPAPPTATTSASYEAPRASARDSPAATRTGSRRGRLRTARARDRRRAARAPQDVPRGGRAGRPRSASFCWRAETPLEDTCRLPGLPRPERHTWSGEHDPDPTARFGVVVLVDRVRARAAPPQLRRATRDRPRRVRAA